MVTGDELAYEGQQRAWDAAKAEWKEQANLALYRLAARGEPFTSEDVVAIVGLPRGAPGMHANNAVGALFGAASKVGAIQQIGRRKSQRAALHSHNVAIWQGVL